MQKQSTQTLLIITAFSLFFFLFSPSISTAGPPLVLAPNAKMYQLGSHLSILEDEAGDLTIEDVKRPDKAEKFVPAKRLIPNFGFTNSVFWVKFSVINPLADEQSLLLEDAYPHHDIVEVYFDINGTGMQVFKGGDTLPYSRRQVNFRNILFLLDIPAEATATVYLRFKSESSMQLHLILWRPIALLEKVDREGTFLGGYFGVMLAMMLYNLFLFAFLKDRNYFFYFLYILSFVFAQMGVSRFDFQYLWPDYPTFANLSHPVFFNLTFFFGCLFCKYFLETKKNSPWLDKVIILLMGVSVVGVALSILVGYTAGILCVVLVTAIFVPIILLTVGIRCWAKGITIARYYTIGWAVFLIAAVAFNLRNMGVFPSIFITDFSPHIGSAIEVLFLSLALADRISVIEKQKLAAEKALANELENSNINLEEKVKKRTQELEATNKELVAAHDELKRLATTDPLTKLANRRSIMEKIQYAISRYMRNKVSFSIVICDIDNFKRFNDNYGHDCGDFVLVSIADFMRSSIRGQDSVARWGGEEFLFLLPDTDQEGARIFADKIREGIASTEYKYKDTAISITMTFGICEYGVESNITTCINNADAALYKGKECGKNCVYTC